MTSAFASVFPYNKTQKWARQLLGWVNKWNKKDILLIWIQQEKKLNRKVISGSGICVIMVYTFKRIVHPKMSILSSLTHLSKTHIKLHWLFFPCNYNARWLRFSGLSLQMHHYKIIHTTRALYSKSSEVIQPFFCADQDKISVNIYWKSKSVNLVELWSDHSGWEWSLMTFKVANKMLHRTTDIVGNFISCMEILKTLWHGPNHRFI